MQSPLCERAGATLGATPAENHFTPSI